MQGDFFRFGGNILWSMTPTAECSNIDPACTICIRRLLLISGKYVRYRCFTIECHYDRKSPLVQVSLFWARVLHCSCMIYFCYDLEINRWKWRGVGMVQPVPLMIYTLHLLFLSISWIVTQSKYVTRFDSYCLVRWPPLPPLYCLVNELQTMLLEST